MTFLVLCYGSTTSFQLKWHLEVETSRFSGLWELEMYLCEVCARPRSHDAEAVPEVCFDFARSNHHIIRFDVESMEITYIQQLHLGVYDRLKRWSVAGLRFVFVSFKGFLRLQNNHSHYNWGKNILLLTKTIPSERRGENLFPFFFVHRLIHVNGPPRGSFLDKNIILTPTGYICVFHTNICFFLTITPHQSAK